MTGRAPRLSFLLPVKGGGGGANSVVQEAMGLRRFGVEVSILVDRKNHRTFSANYPELLEGQIPVAPFHDDVSLAALVARCDVCCATTNASVGTLRAALEKLPAKAAAPRLAYYVQDYEPLFYEMDAPEWRTAYDSYTLLPGAVLFAKTRWLCAMVFENHGVPVAKVSPSIDSRIFFPDLGAARGERITVAAMLRPRTRRRAPLRTARTLAWIAREFGDVVGIETFGAADEELDLHGVDLPPGAINHGPLRRTVVPGVLRRSDLFLDLSDYQAFGRTALEAMASGCTPVVPVFGGAGEFARHGWNGFVVDTRSDDAIRAAIARFIAMTPAERATLRLNGLTTAAEFSVERAVASELQVLFHR